MLKNNTNQKTSGISLKMFVSRLMINFIYDSRRYTKFRSFISPYPRLFTSTFLTIHTFQNHILFCLATRRNSILELKSNTHNTNNGFHFYLRVFCGVSVDILCAKTKNRKRTNAIGEISIRSIFVRISTIATPEKLTGYFGYCLRVRDIRLENVSSVQLNTCYFPSATTVIIFSTFRYDVAAKVYRTR